MTQENNITEELKQMGSSLAAVPRTMPYTVPDGYFQQLDQRMARYTDPIPTATMPYAVPDGYFDKLPQAVLKTARQPDVKPRFTISTRYVQWAAAAAFVVMTGVGYNLFFGTSATGSRAETLIAALQPMEINDYLQQNYRLNQDPTDKDISLAKIDKREIISYLNETGWE